MRNRFPLTLTLTLSLTLTLTLTRPASASAPNPSAAEDGAAYCRYVRGVADSERALLFSPQIFANAGLVNGSGVITPETSALPTTFRLTAGLRYSGLRLYQGLLTGQRAAADCDQYRVSSELHAFLQAHRDVSTRPALEARAAVLREALPQAEAILRDLRAAVAASRASVDELHAAELRVDGLRGELAQAEQDRDGQAEWAPPSRPLAELLNARDAAEEREERVEARLRQSQGWDVSVQGGYDRSFGTAAAGQVPAFALVSLSFTPGTLWQPAADARARAGRLRWVRAQVEGLDQRVEEMRRRLSATLRSEQRRLHEVAVLRADVDARIQAVAGLSGDRVKRYREYLFFDEVKLKAEHAYLTAHVRDLAAALGGD